MYRLKRFALYLHAELPTPPVKVGQVAVSFGLKRRVFAESLMLLPAYQSLWFIGMCALLETLGAGEYRYGTPWSHKPPQDFALFARVAKQESFTAYTIEFSKWSNWPAYYAALSNNIKRNARRALDQYGDRLSLHTYRGLYSLSHYPAFVRFQRARFSNKGIAVKRWGLMCRFLARVLMFGNDVFISFACVDGKPEAAFYGLTFGQATYSIGSGFHGNSGSSWWLMLEMLQNAFMRAPHGRFMLGIEPESDPSKGMSFFRAQCRATATPTQVVLFQYAVRQRHKFTFPV